MGVLKVHGLPSGFPAAIRRAVEFLIEKDGSVCNGSFCFLEGGLQVIKLAYNTSIQDKSFQYELHSKVCDVHVVLQGEECVSTIERSEGRLVQEYNEEFDYELYQSEIFNAVRLGSRDIAIFPPNVLHATGYNTGEMGVIKFVIKAPSELALFSKEASYYSFI